MVASSDEIFLSECVLHMFAKGSFQLLTHDQIERLESIKAAKPVTKDGKRKSTKAERETFSLPEGTEVFRKLGGVEYVGTWTGSAILWEDTEFATPTAFAKAVWHSVNGYDKTHAINGWEACYIKTEEGKQATLKSLRE